MGLAARLRVVFVVPSAISYLRLSGPPGNNLGGPFHCLLRYRRRYCGIFIVSPSFIAD